MQRSAVALTASDEQGKVYGWIWSSRASRELRKLWRKMMTSSPSSSGGNVEAYESWGMMLPPICCTVPCEQRATWCCAAHRAVPSRFSA